MVIELTPPGEVIVHRVQLSGCTGRFYRFPYTEILKLNYELQIFDLCSWSEYDLNDLFDEPS